MSIDTVPAAAPIHPPRPLREWLDRAAADLIMPPGAPPLDLTKPAGEAALVPPTSVSWRIFKNPVAMFVGGVAAVILELAEPRVRTGVWDHTSFRADPVTRLRRTGAAAMITVYGARSQAEAMIAGVRRRHDKVTGTTPSGVTYEANDPELLNWVQATAAFGFLEAYMAFVRPLSSGDQDRLYAEGVEGSRLYGALNTPTSRATLEAQFAAMRPQLEASPIVHEFLDIVAAAPILPPLLRPLQQMMVRGAVDVVPAWAKALLGLERRGLRSFEAPLLRRVGGIADRVIVANGPGAQACKRVGLPAEYLYRQPA